MSFLSIESFRLFKVFAKPGCHVDGAFCVPCVLFSNDNGQKLISLPEKDWCNIHQTCKRHAKPPEHQAGKKTSPHLVSSESLNFIQVFEGSVVPVPLQLDSQRKIQIGKNRHVLVQILKLLHRLGKQNIAIRGKNRQTKKF